MATDRELISDIWTAVLLIRLKMEISKRPSGKSAHICIYANLYLNIKYRSRDLSATERGYEVARYFVCLFKKQH